MLTSPYVTHRERWGPGSLDEPCEFCNSEYSNYIFISITRPGNKKSKLPDKFRNIGWHDKDICICGDCREYIIAYDAHPGYGGLSCYEFVELMASGSKTIKNGKRKITT